MSNNNVNNDKKKSLLAYKEKILEEIKYYDTRIENFRANNKTNSYNEDDDSSDSDDELLQMIDMGPSIAQLKLKQEVMKTCLLATQELTSLTVLQSQVNVLVDAPEIDRERPITEPGLWIEVTAECEIDLINFTIHFYMHKPYRTFAPPSYRCLRVEPVRDSDKLELDRSVLHSLKLPSDAVEVMKSYNAAFRSRRTTLSKLDKKFANSLLMEKHPEGGYVFKCAGLLEVCWRLENKWSPVAPFHHRMKFDLEYMDEAYIKIITQAHKQLLDPSLQTDERTTLLSKIITTCIEARGPIESESDLESKTEKDEFEKRDSEVMAPPKSLPKKLKVKDTQKRSLDEENNTKVKKLKTNEFESLNSRKTKIVDEYTSVVKKMKINDGVASANNVRESNGDGNVQKNKSPRDGNTEDKIDEPKNKVKKSNAEVKNANTKVKNKIANEAGNIEENSSNTNTKGPKESAIEDNEVHVANNIEKPETVTAKDKNGNTKTKSKIPKDSGNNAVAKVSNKPKNIASEMTEDKSGNTNPKTKSSKDSGNIAAKKPDIKSKNVVSDNTEENNGNTMAKKKSPKDNGNTAQNKTTTPENVNENTEENNFNTIAKKKSPKDTGNTAPKKTKTSENVNENTEENNGNTNAKQKIPKDSGNTAAKKTMIKPKTAVNENTDKNNDNPKPKNKTVENHGNTELNKVSKTKTKITKEPSNLEQGSKVRNTQKETGNTEKGNTNTKPKNTEKKEMDVASTKNAVNKNIATKDVDRQNKVVIKKSNVAITKKSDTNLNKAVTNTVNNKTSVVSTKTDDDLTKKTTDINTKNKDNGGVLNKGITKIKDTPKDGAIIKKTTQKNATNRIKDKISTIPEKVSEKHLQDKHTDNIKNNTKTFTNPIKKPSKEPPKMKIIQKISSHRTSIKLPNNKLKASNTGIKSGNNNKDDGKPKSKIPQKKLSPINESSTKKNPLRISPRKLPTKFKSTGGVMKHRLVKTTSIPRLMKDSVPKRAQ